MQFSTATAFISELLPDSDNTGGRPRDSTSCVKERKEMLLNYQTVTPVKLSKSQMTPYKQCHSVCVRKQNVHKITYLTDA